MMEAWRAAIRAITIHGRFFLDDEKREGKEIANLTITIEEPATTADGIRAMRRFRGWRYPSEEELASIILNKEGGFVYDYLYGQRIFSYNEKLNQVDGYVIPLLKERPGTRRAIISLLNPIRDLKVNAQNVLGVSLIHFRIINGRLNVTAVIRTSGFFTGWPANVFQVAKLQEYVSRNLQLPPGALTTVSLSAHVHEENHEEIRAVLGPDVIGQEESQEESGGARGGREEDAGGADGGE